jgi:hypothetical protein
LPTNDGPAAKSDPTNGDGIPKMAIVQAAWDHIEISLAKLGLATIQTSTLGSACMPGSYDAPANVDDPGLKSWLTAIGETNVTLQQSWTAIRGVSPQQGLDSEGKLVTITPKVWVSAKRVSTTTPATVSFENGCGRVLFSTYHTEGNGNAALLAQEKALLYLLLEVGVCVGQPPPPR